MVRSLFSIFLSIILYNSIFSQDLNYAEYFWDADPGPMNGTQLTISPGDFISQISSIETEGLESGFHQLFIRVCDEDNTCSLYASVLVMIQSTQVSIINQAEYFWDVDPGVGMGNELSVSPGAGISESYNFETSGLEPGYHYLYLRVMDDSNTWSLFQKVLVYIDGFAPIFITEMEYFWDTDPGVGNATPIDIESAEIISGNFPVSSEGLELGDHWLHIRVKDAEGAWSLYHRLLINICTNFSPTAEFEFEIVDGQFNFVSNSSFADNLSWQVDGTEQGTESEFSITPTGQQEVCLIASNECASDTLCFTVGAPFLELIDPSLVSNNGPVSINAFGYLLDSATEVEIRKDGETIVASSLQIVSSDELNVDFNFSNETTGFWDFVVILENGNELVLESGLELFETLALADQSDIQPILFPNPADNFTQIRGIEISELRVYSIYGSEVLRTSEKKFSVESLAPGLYSVVITTNNLKTYSLKLIVQ